MSMRLLGVSILKDGNGLGLAKRVSWVDAEEKVMRSGGW